MNQTSDLDVPFLHKVLEKLREIPLGEFATSGNFYEFVPSSFKDDERTTRLFVAEHLDYLEAIGLVRYGAKTQGGTYGTLKLTAEGRHFVQPELAQFYGEVLAQLVPAFEAQIDSSSLPDAEKHTLKYKLREALANRAPELAVRLMVEIVARLASQ